MTIHLENTPATTAPEGQKAENAARQRGFTLVELMVVIVILGGLIAIVGPNIWRALVESDISRAEAQMNSIAGAVDMYMMQNRKLPGDLSELTQEDQRTGEPYMANIPDDPWGNSYQLKALERRKYQIVCAGEDGVPETDDDIVHPKSEDR